MTSRAAYRILIAGAGPVGLAVAAGLLELAGRDRLDIRVVDPGPAPAWRAGHIDLRVYALSRATENLLRGVGAWDTLVERGISPYEKMQVWEGADAYGAGSIGFDCADIGEPNLGYIAEDVLLRDVLTARILAAARASISFGVGIESVRPGPERVSVGLDSGEGLDCHLLVAADGGRSAIREMLGLPCLTRDYRQHALVTHIETQRPHERTARQRFLPTGPIAFLPLADGRSSVVWSVEDGTCLEQVEGSDDALVDALQAASGNVLGAITDVGERAVFPLLARHAPRYATHRVALIGDAAHCVHPLAGQGMNLGLLDAAGLAREIAQAVAAGEDPGDLRVLRRYERARKGDNLAMLLALDGLDRLFRAGDRAGIVRRAGMGLIDRTRPAKHVLMQRALGLPGHFSKPKSRGPV